MPLYTPPKTFVKELRSFDPLLRVRWSDMEHRWRIERKITHARSIDPDRFRSQDYEEFVARRDGYLPILFCKYHQLDERIFHVLYAADLHRAGGAKKVADELDRLESDQRAKSRTKWLDEVYEAARERYDYLNRVRTIPENALHTAPKGGVSIMGSGY